MDLKSKPAQPSGPVEPTALMNPGDEVDDNIWVQRPRNRLQPGQTTAPDPSSRVVASRKAPESAATKTSPSVEADSRAKVAAPTKDAPVSGLEGLAVSKTATNDTVRASATEKTRTGDPTRPAAKMPASEPPRPAVGSSAPKATADSVAPTHTGEGGKPVWSIALATFSGDDHRASAEAACAQFAGQFPELKGAFVRSRTSGSVIMWGEFDGPRDARAKPELDRLKKIEFGNGRPFARAMLARLEQFSEEEMAPWDLRQVRRLHPNVRVIYTLQVAAWSDLGSGTMKFEQIRRSAEDYCRQLRGQNVDAWFHHDADQLTSIVTVGVFGPKAYDAQSTLYAPEVEVLRRRFPTSLLNGEEVRTKGGAADPQASVSQPSRLVEVPQ